MALFVDPKYATKSPTRRVAMTRGGTYLIPKPTTLDVRVGRGDGKVRPVDPGGIKHFASTGYCTRAIGSGYRTEAALAKANAAPTAGRANRRRAGGSFRFALSPAIRKSSNPVALPVPHVSSHSNPVAARSSRAVVLSVDMTDPSFRVGAPQTHAQPDGRLFMVDAGLQMHIWLVPLIAGGAALLGAALAIWGDGGYYSTGEVRLVAGHMMGWLGLAGLVVSAILLIPYQTQYWKYYHVDGQLQQVSNRLVGGSGDNQGRDFWPARIDGKQVVMIDNRIFNYSVGDDVKLTCTVQWMYQGQDQLNCFIRSY